MSGTAGAMGVIGPLWLMLQIEFPIFLLADALPTRKTPFLVRVLLVVALLSPVALHLIAFWGEEVDAADYLLTFGALLLLSAASVWAVFSTSIWTAFFCSSAGYTAQGFATGVQQILRSTTWYAHLPYLAGMPDDLVLLAVYIGFYLLFVRKVRKSRLELVADRRMLPAFGMCILAVIGLDVLLKQLGSQGIATSTVLALRCVHLAFCAFLLAFEYRSLVGSRLEIEAAVDRHILEERSRQYEESRLSIEAVNRRMHDIVRSTTEAARQMGALDNPQVNELLVQMVSEVNHYDAIIHTGNEALDTVLTEKSLVCESNGMSLSPIADGEALANLGPAEIYVLVGGVLDLMIGQVRRVSDPSRRDISFIVRRRESMVTITVQGYEAKREEDEKGEAHRELDRLARRVVDAHRGSVSSSAEGDTQLIVISLPTD
ncbi:hypothetical protein AUL39_07940 [Tractidigestivibacter scatoligenes]|uniref:Uncharacterized protein n=1 Tax=Tractidigestivibacter scatoligenes TaxID=1299998 RepID=A0A124EGP5_TRASO|nr:hypothetical protein [Tractidigestivibacter scatoligenes]KUH58137.1 hypothetical protein AUL39_07940 [Tractidigestivibacter scatoligenes]